MTGSLGNKLLGDETQGIDSYANNHRCGSTPRCHRLTFKTFKISAF